MTEEEIQKVKDAICKKCDLEIGLLPTIIYSDKYKAYPVFDVVPTVLRKIIFKAIQETEIAEEVKL